MKQMINKFAKYLLALCAVAATASCDSFLDRQEDETMTFDKIWQQVSTTKQYFFQAMSFLPNDTEIFYHSQKGMYCIGAADESSCTWAWSGYQSINFGSWNPANMPTDGFNYFYNGILECNIFLANVMKCSDPTAEPTDLKLWYNCARWARAYYYFMLMRDYGPVFLVGDEPLDSSASLAALARPRNTWEECVEYVVNEMEECAMALPVKYDDHGKWGLPTQGAALAVISRLKLYSARDLFNGNTLYNSVRNPDNTPLFPQEKDPKKWVEAAQAAKAVLDLKEADYKLYRADNSTGKASQGDAVKNYLGITQELWNAELIYCGGGRRSRYTMGVHVAPAVASGTAYGGWGPTQQQVDAYAMTNGRYPITGYEENGQPIVDGNSGYNANEFAVEPNFVNPMLLALGAPQQYYMVNTRNMYVNREPRFYVSVFFAGSYWMHDKATLSGSDMVSFCRGANGHMAHDYPKSGYLVNRFYDHTSNSFAGNWGKDITFPTFRLGEIYLNYIEAVLECERNGVNGEGVDRSLAMQLWTDLRGRSGLDPIEEVYPGASIDELIELVRKERRVELAFEGHRFYDTRTWMIATQTDNGPMYGMDTNVPAMGTETPEKYWKRTVFEKRVFKENHYLFPIPQREINLNDQIVQNYGW